MGIPPRYSHLALAQTVLQSEPGFNPGGPVKTLSHMSLLMSLAAITAVTAMTGCSAIKNMDAMKEKTDEMSAVMKGMASDVKETKETSKGMAVDVRETKETSQGMAGDVKATRDTSQGMAVDVRATKEVSQSMESKVSMTNATALATYMDLRAKDSADARIKFMEKLKEAPTLEEKIAWAGMYMQAFEFQLWKDQSLDDAQAREVLKAQGVKEFFRQLSGLIKSDYIEPGNEVLGQIAPDSEFLSLFALAVSMHLVHHSQEVVKERTGAQPESMFDIVAHGLKYKWAVDAGNKTPEQIPEYARQVLFYEPVARYLLQLRHNGLGKMALGKLLGLSSHPGFDIKTFWAALPKKLWSWQADFANLNEVQIWEINRWLREAVRTREVMSRIGVPSVYDKGLMQVAGNMKTEEIAASLKSLKPARQAYIKEFLGSFETYRK
jgi:hypothetical protein